jgi:hypothetical protein
LLGKNAFFQYSSMMEDGRQLHNAARLTELAKKLFPGHPAKRIVLEEIISGNKKAPTRYRGAQIEDYARHLSLKSYEGPGALGLFPGYPKHGERCQKSRWFVKWIAMDYDNRNPEELLPLLDRLEEDGIYAYLTHGTTGRGAHLFIFFADPVPQPKAHRALRTIADLSGQMGVGTPEIRPSAPYTSGAPIFLPYRGAEGDGHGYNPLLNPQTLLPVHLLRVPEEIRKTEPDDFLVLASEPRPGWRANPGSQNKAGEAAVGAGGSEAWEEELRRLEGEWREGRRQRLALGATAYGLTLGITPEKTEEDLRALAQSANDPEVSRRMEAVRHTVRKYVTGERVAWIRWYEQAGLEAPRIKPAPSPEMLSILEQLVEHVVWGRSYWATIWKRKKGLTAWSLCRAAARVAWTRGVLLEDGVEVGLSTRALAEEAEVGHKAALNGLRTLDSANLAKRSESGTGTRAGKIVLLTERLPTILGRLGTSEEGCSTPLTPLTPLPRGGAERMVSLGLSAPHLRWGPGRPGKAAEAVLALLLRTGAATEEEIAEALMLASQRERRNLEDTLELLEGRGLVRRDDRTYHPAPDFEDVLHRSCQLDGSLDAAQRDRERHEQERKDFRGRLREAGERHRSTAEPSK